MSLRPVPHPKPPPIITPKIEEVELIDNSNPIPIKSHLYCGRLTATGRQMKLVTQKKQEATSQKPEVNNNPTTTQNKNGFFHSIMKFRKKKEKKERKDEEKNQQSIFISLIDALSPYETPMHRIRKPVSPPQFHWTYEYCSCCQKFHHFQTQCY
jgi:hypothetical protein